MLQVKDKIFNETILSFVLFVLDNAGKITTNIHFRYELKKEYATRISNGILKYDKAIIEVEAKEKTRVENTLNSICSNWNDRIQINYK